MKNEEQADMREERHAFIANVPFTLIEAINFVLSNKIENADSRFFMAHRKQEKESKRQVYSKMYIS